MIDRKTSIIRTVASIMTVVTLTIISFYISEVTAYANVMDLTIKAEPYYIDTASGRIYVESAESEYFLFLPNEADLSSIAVKAENGSDTVTLVKDDSEYEALDLSNELAEGGSCDVEAVIKDRGGNRTGGFSLRIMRGTGIGTLYYFSADPGEKGRKWIDRSQDNRGSGKVLFFDENAKNLTEDAKNQVIDDIHGRGHASWLCPKKSYQIKFNKKIALIDGTGKEKKWVLSAQYADPLRMSDIISKRIAGYIRSDFSPKAIWINFYYDGEYRGVYELSEKNEVKSGRINISNLEDEYEKQDPEYGKHADLRTAYNSYGMQFRYQDGLTGPDKAGGFLIEMNDDLYDEDNGFTYKAGDRTRGMNIKSPEHGSREYVSNVSEFFQEFADAIYAVDEDGAYTGKNPGTGKYFYEYCDIDSLADTYLMQLILSNWDAFKRSLYFYKDIDDIMFAGPIWDMDLTIGTWAYTRAKPDEDKMGEAALAESLIRISDFRKVVSRRYLDIYSGVLESLISTGKDLPTFRELFGGIKNDLDMDSSIWRVKAISSSTTLRWDDDTPLSDIVDYRVSWLKRRKKYLDSYFRQMAGDEEEEHEYGPASAVTATTHKKACVNHPDVVVTEDCTFETVSNGDGTHTRACTQCTNAETEPCSMEYSDNGDGTHTGTCSECGYTKADSHTWDMGKVIQKAAVSKPGRAVFTCTLCGAAEQREIPAVDVSDITINSGKVKAAAVKKIIARVEAAGGTTDSIILGRKVKAVKKGAFRKTGIRTVIVKTKKLKAASVKSSLKGSSVKAVIVKIGSRKTNRKYVKKYKKIFTKKNAGIKVRVR